MSKSRPRSAAAQVPVSEYRDYKEYLARIFAQIKADEGKYSYGQFAEDLGFSRSNVIWLVIVGKRRLTPLTCNRIVEALGLSNEARRYFALLVKHNNARSAKQREKYMEKLLALKSAELPSPEERDKLEYFGEWYYPVIREMVRMPEFRPDPQSIAAQLYGRLMPKEILGALDLLKRLSLVKTDENSGRLTQEGGQIEPNRLVEKLAAIRYHETMLDIAKESINRIEPERRDFNALTVCISDETAAKLKALIYDFCSKIMELENSQSQHGDQIYQLNIQLFPFTKKNR